ncbi:MAG TPA: HXXEE domain-containing protein [Lactobacillus sp.]|nr:HXXEE domain-containing protein [Lactobacillus sp.]
MNRLIKHWYEIEVYIAGFYVLLLVMGSWSLLQKTLLLGLVFIHLHFFEEFGFPGGFAWGGIKVEMGHVSADARLWPLNQLSSLWGNEWFAIIVYLLPLFFPQMRWLVLGAIIFAYFEFLMHVVIFNLGLHSWYNPGSLTAVFGLTLSSSWGLWQLRTQNLFNWKDLIISLLWIFINYWIAFRSPAFKFFNNKKKFTFSRQDVLKSDKYMQKFGVTVDDFKHLNRD